MLSGVLLNANWRHDLCAAFDRNRVSAHEIDLGNKGDTELGIYVGSDLRSQTGNSATDKEKVVCRSFHVSPHGGRNWNEPPSARIPVADILLLNQPAKQAFRRKLPLL